MRRGSLGRCLTRLYTHGGARAAGATNRSALGCYVCPFGAIPTDGVTYLCLRDDSYRWQHRGRAPSRPEGAATYQPRAECSWPRPRKRRPGLRSIKPAAEQTAPPPSDDRRDRTLPSDRPPEVLCVDLDCQNQNLQSPLVANPSFRC